MQNTRAHNLHGVGGTARPGRRGGFTLLEVMTSLVILAFVSSSVLVVINRSILSAADSSLRAEAFKIARENMELLLVGNAVSETVEYGTSELNPGISWRTAVETFAEPISGRTWVRAVCSAEYSDSKGELQTVELVQWLTELTDRQAVQLTQEQSADLATLAAEQLLEYLENAAQYARVEPETVEQWLADGLATTAEGAFIKYNLNIFVRSEGAPTDEQKAQQVSSIEELAAVLAGGGDDAEAGPVEETLREEMGGMDVTGNR